MNFQVLSHAGLLVNGTHKSLVTDPWILGSCYWRSWWNYPPVKEALVNTLNPDVIYLTHIHWDHFQGPSLKKLGKDKLYLVPKGNYSRIKKDLNDMGIHNVIELRHGESYEIETGFKVTSYQIGIFLDSALVIECNGVKVLNLNDAKFMGGPLKQIDKKHGPFDFTLRSHSSANSRLSYEIFDEKNEDVDDIEYYIKNFALSVQAVRTKYAVPFASNQCHLHSEVLKFNTMARTPQMVKEYFDKNNIQSPQLKVMISGDQWSSESGFNIQENDYFTNREKNLTEYKASKQEILDKHDILESKSKINMKVIEKYYTKLFSVIPLFFRYRFKNHPIVYVLTAGENIDFIEIDIWNKTVKKLDTLSELTHPAQIHVSTYIFMMSIRMDLFSHLSISKRVLFYVSKSSKKYIQLLNLCYNCYEYDLFPIYRIFTYRSIETWVLRWREIILYLLLIRDKYTKGHFQFDKHLKPAPTVK